MDKMTMHLQKSLLIIIFLAISFCMLTIISVHHHPIQQQIYQASGNLEDLGVQLNTKGFSIRVDDLFIQNVSEKVLENIRNESYICSKVRKELELLPTIYLVTPTYKRPEQVPDLTRLAQTLMHVPSIFWLVVEDSHTLSPVVADILRRSGIKYVHMVAPMPEEQKKKKVKARGVSNRNRALKWIRDNYVLVDKRGILYFADDDNTYDLRLFDEIRSVKKFGMFPVGLITSLGVSSPIIKNGLVTGFYDGWIANRKFPVDMAGFALHLDLILNNLDAKMPFTPGYEEDGFLKSLNLTRFDIEPKAENCTKIYVWHTQTKKNKIPVKMNDTLYNDTNIKYLYDFIS